MIRYPAPSGTHLVGFADGEVIDSRYPRGRASELVSRRLPLRVWYPAAAASDEPWEGDADVFVPFARFGIVPESAMLELARAECSATRDAPAAVGSWPVLIYSHGANGYLDQNVALMEELASHGYLVVAFGHPGGACAVRHADGTIDGIDEAFLDAINGSIGPMFIAFTGGPEQRLAFASSHLVGSAAREHADRWADDFRAVLDALHARTILGSASTIVDHADLQQVAVGGFSYSGPAATLVAHEDERVCAAINLDGGDGRPELLDVEVRVPTLAISTEQGPKLSLMTGLALQTVDFHEFSYESLSTIGTRSDVHRILIEEAAHSECTDIVLTAKEDRVGLPIQGQVDADYVIPRINGLFLGFLDRYLKEEGSFPSSQLEKFPGLRTVDLRPIREWAPSSREES